MQQIFKIAQQEASHMQFMLNINGIMSKAYVDLVSNFNSTLTNLVLTRRDAYLHHALPNLDAFRLVSLYSAPVSGGDLFDRAMMQEYKQLLISLGVETSTKKERFYPYKKKKGSGSHQHQHAPLGGYYQPVPEYGALLLSPSGWSQRRLRQSQMTWPRRQYV